MGRITQDTHAAVRRSRIGQRCNETHCGPPRRAQVDESPHPQAEGSPAFLGASFLHRLVGATAPFRKPSAQSWMIPRAVETAASRRADADVIMDVRVPRARTVCIMFRWCMGIAPRSDNSAMSAARPSGFCPEPRFSQSPVRSRYCLRDVSPHRRPKRCRNQLTVLHGTLGEARLWTKPDGLAALIAELSDRGAIPMHQANIDAHGSSPPERVRHDHIRIGPREAAVLDGAWDHPRLGRGLRRGCGAEPADEGRKRPKNAEILRLEDAATSST